MGSSTENSAYFPTRNPWDLERVPGGSSGGSAATVAALEAPLSLGSDTGGSVRQPAAFCGVYGLKPTYGAVSRYGLVAFASTLDQIGPIARTARDTALLYNAICGLDERDSTSRAEAKPMSLEDLERGVRGLKVGIPRDLVADGVDPEVLASLDRVAKTLEGEGASILDVALPHARYSIATYYLIAPAEASSNLARYDGVRYGFRAGRASNLQEMYAATRGTGFGREVRRRILLGTYALSAGYYDAYYVKAQKVRTIIKREFDAVFEKVDALVTPTSPTVAFPIGAKTNDPLQMYLNDVFTLPVNIAGLPGLSMPCGLSEGLPVGLQIIANSYQERMLFRVAAAFEGATEHHQQHPMRAA
jgi:aspartyl-tRNA(Asn)/glutamyl-tRNA(Gln) amidotransferase subunit A